MRVLLTGSSGWLGRFVAPLLHQAGHEPVGLDVAAGRHTDVIGSVADRTLIDRLFGEYGIEAVIHSGALHKPDIARYPTQAFVAANVTGTLNLLEAAVAHGARGLVFTSTTSLMISTAIRNGLGDAAVWIDETMAPLEPRNIYGVTKLSAEHLCRLFHAEHGLPVLTLRTARFFPEEDDTQRALAGENMKANEFLHRRLTVEDAAAAHIVALEKMADIGHGTFILAAPTPFAREEARALKQDAATVIARHFPDAAGLYARRGWVLPRSIDRVYDAALADHMLGFRCATDFAAVLDALRDERPLPFRHERSHTAALPPP